ncbi:MAG: apolipoprotein N-acyltransferase, partial [Bacteroidales bacterium]|nr:apolipoprotein N-acyltransferase [Bacteroidales bacterium]
IMTIVMQLFHRSRKVFVNRRLGYIALVVYWVAFEYAHHNWDLTYPWLSLGNGFASWPSWIQWYEYTGILGGTIWILSSNIFVLFVIKDIVYKRSPLPKEKIIVLLSVVIVPLTITMLIFYNYKTEGEGINIIVVQPNNDPYTEQYHISPDKAIDNMMNLASPFITNKTDIVAGPESMIQEDIWERHIDRSRGVRKMREYLARYPHLTMVTGASSFRMVYKGEMLRVSNREFDSEYYLRAIAEHYDMPFDSLSGYYDAYNMALVLDTGKYQGAYHKSKLVAGVERMPFKRWLAPLFGDFALDMGGTIGTLAMDEERKVFLLRNKQKKYGIAICYESVFGEFFGKFVKNGADFMLIITNDGWWGDTPGHRHHNSFARIRAIETRRSIARSANTGISCFVDQRGVITQPTPYDVEDAIAATIYTNEKITFYVKYGDYIGRIALFCAILLLLIQFSLRFIPKKREKIR